MAHQVPSLEPGKRESLPLRLLGQVLLHALWAGSLALAAWAMGLPDSPPAGWFTDAARPEGWFLFATVLAPLGLLLPALAGEWLALRALSLAALPAQAGAVSLTHSYRRWQMLTFLAWPVMLVAVAWHARLGDWLLPLAAAYLGCLAARALLLAAVSRAGARFLDEVGAGASRMDNWIVGAMALGSAVIFAALALWTFQAISTAGDEPLYLINAHRHLIDLGLAGGDAASPALRGAFYWGRWSPALAHHWARAPLFTWLLAPAYLVAGRLGTLLLLAAAGGLCLALVVRLARGLGFGRHESLAAAWVLGMSPPFLLLTQHVYPDLLAVLAVAGALTLLLEPSGRPLARLAAVAVLAVLTASLKLRFLPVAGALVLLAWLRLWGARLTRRTWLIAAGGGLLALLLALSVLQVLGFPLHYLIEFVGLPGQFKAGPMAAALPALFFDQEYGLIFLAPWTILALAGGIFLFRSRPWLGWSTLVLALAVLGPLLIWRWIQWDGGFTPAARYLAPLLPLLALMALPALACRGARTMRVWAWCLITLSVLWSFLMCLAPLWRYQRRIGASNLWVWGGEQAHAHLERFFPSFVGYFGPEMILALPWLGLVALTGLLLWRWRRNGACARPAGSGRLTAALTLILLLALGGGLLWAGRSIPSGHFQAESMRRRGAMLYGTYYPELRYLLLNRAGDSASKWIVWGGHSRELVLWGLGVHVGPSGAEPAGPLPALAVEVDGHPAGRLTLAWGDLLPYTLPLKLTPGPHLLTLRYAFKPGRSQIAIDRLAVR